MITECVEERNFIQLEKQTNNRIEACEIKPLSTKVRGFLLFFYILINESYAKDSTPSLVSNTHEGVEMVGDFYQAPVLQCF